jgi:transcription termination factor Rho
MSSVLDRSALAESPLADLHLLANELGIDGFRRLRKDDLIDAILTKQAGDDLARPEGGDAGGGDDDEEAPTRSRRGRRGGRTRARSDDDDRGDDKPADKPARGGRGQKPEKKDDKPAEDKEIEGVIELLGNGSAFVRLTEGETSDDDVYVSAAQVKRCELVSGDKVAGPMRPPRRSERFPSLVRVDTINGKPADEVSEGTRFDDLPVAFPAERLELGSDDATVNAIEWLTPFGKGSRVTVVGPARAGKSDALRRIAAALADKGGVELTVVLAGVRPEEVGEWQDPIAPAASVTFAASADSQGQAVEHAVEQARRVAARGADAVVIVDSLEYVSPAVARRALAAARNIVDGGSLTVIVSAPAARGGETTVIALDAALVAMGRFPALDLANSGTMRPELLVGDAGAEAIAKARADTAA